MRTLLDRTAHDNLEIVVVYDDPTPPEVLAELREVAGDKLTFERFTRPFNYSEKMNVGCLRASGERLVFLNDDVEVISHGWLEQLVAPLDEPDVGMTGARLYFSDDTIQHAGHALDAATTCTPTGTFRVSPTDHSAPSSSIVRRAA